MVERKEWPWGWADSDAGKTPVVIGDRAVPKRIEVTAPGADGQPGLRLVLEVVDGVPRCSELALTAVEGGRGVRQLDLDAINVNDWVAEIFASHAGVVRQIGNLTQIAYGPDTPERHFTAAEQFRRARRTRSPRRLNRVFLQTVADAYNSYKPAPGVRPAPTRHVADVLNVGHRTASGYLTKVREAGIPLKEGWSNDG
ncbi:MAG: hypothetical protein ACR2MN_04255 [Acidimicrobiales bacterium]